MTCFMSKVNYLTKHEIKSISFNVEDTIAEVVIEISIPALGFSREEEIEVHLDVAQIESIFKTVLEQYRNQHSDENIKNNFNFRL